MTKPAYRQWQSKRRPSARLWVCVMLLFSGCGMGAVEAPSEFQKWNAKDGTFQIDYPGNWEADGGGRHGVQWATFKSGSAQVDVTVSVTDSVVGDILGAGSGGEATKLRVNEYGQVVPEGQEIPPVAIIHEAKREEMEDEYGDYREREAIDVRCALGEGRKSEFKAKNGILPIHGYRATVLNNRRGITVICQCSEQDWETVRGTFDQMIDSLGRGTAVR